MLISWKPLVTKCWQCVKETTHEVNKNAVAVVCTNSHCKEEVVGHVQQNIPFIVLIIIPLPHCALGISVSGKRVNHGGEYGLETALYFDFYGHEKAVKLVKKENNKDQRKRKTNL